MDYQNVFDQFYNELTDIPEFPTEKAEKLRGALPPLSRDLAGLIYLLPFGKDATKTEISYARVMSLITLSAFIHGDLEKNDAFPDNEAVLYGDYLFALSFSLIPSDIPAEEAMKLLEITYRYGENRSDHPKENISEKDMLLFAKEDYGTPLLRTAQKATENRDIDRDIKEAYETCAEDIGTAWGILCEKYPVSPLPCLKRAEATASHLPMAKELEQIIQILKGAALEHDQNISKTL